MGLQASIDIHFAQEYSPKELIPLLIASGWAIDFEKKVSYLLSSDIDDYDWQDSSIKDFNINQFLNTHKSMDRIGIAMVAKKSGGNLLIYPNYLLLSLSINRRYLSEIDRIPDFSWYIKRLANLLNNIKVSKIQCDAYY